MNFIAALVLCYDVLAILSVAFFICACNTPSYRQCAAQLSGERAAHAATQMALDRCEVKNPREQDLTGEWGTRMPRPSLAPAAGTDVDGGDK